MIQRPAGAIIRAVTRLARSVAVGVTILTIGTAGAGGGVSASSPFHLVFDGKHNENLWHEGPFTSSAAFCPSGYAIDVDVDDTTLTAVRRFSCGEGDFTARLGSLRAEHGGTGNWTIIGGTGPLADLRGTGTFTSVRVNGNQDDPASITFRSTWDGFAAFDVLPPTVGIPSASVRKLTRPTGAWRVVALAAVDDAEGATSWRLVVSDRRKPLLPLASKSCQSANGTIRVVIQLRPPKGTRTLRLQLDGTDPVGNHASFVKPLRLP